VDTVIYFWRVCKWKVLYVLAVSLVGILLLSTNLAKSLVEIFVFVLITPFVMGNGLMERARHDVVLDKRKKYRSYVPEDVKEEFERSQRKHNAEMAFTLFSFVVCVIWLAVFGLTK